MNKFFLIILIIVVVAIAGLFFYSANKPQNESNQLFNFGQSSITNSQYPIHTEIAVTYFYVGEKASDQNDYIQNHASAWDDSWQDSYGGVDDPKNRKDYFPAKFTPKENPFYFALPYDDFDDEGMRKTNAVNVYWSDEKVWGNEESMLKNRWIKITKDGKTAYAQWEDSGPFNDDDVEYVFGDKEPENARNDDAGLDVSPAVRDYLELEDIDIVDWQFVSFNDVPNGPWDKILTTSQINWE